MKYVRILPDDALHNLRMKYLDEIDKKCKSIRKTKFLCSNDFEHGYMRALDHVIDDLRALELTLEVEVRDGKAKAVDACV